MNVPVEILGLFLDQASGSSIVLLGDREESTHVLPIFIGSAEAQSIAIGLQGIEPPRPGTHDLMVDVMELMQGHLDRVVVTSLREGAFLAELLIETPTGTVPVDSRPSDGIALAVRFGAPVLVEQHVFDTASVEIDHQTDQPFKQDEIEDIVSEFERFLETATASDFEEPSETAPTESETAPPSELGPGPHPPELEGHEPPPELEGREPPLELEEGPEPPPELDSPHDDQSDEGSAG